MNRYLKLVIGEFVVGFGLLMLTLSIYPKLFEGGNVIVLIVTFLIIAILSTFVQKVFNWRF